MAKVTLVRIPEDGDAGVQAVFTKYESLGLGCIAAVLREAGHQVVIFDCFAMSEAELAEWKTVMVDQILASQADLVGFTLISDMNYGNVEWSVGELRQRGLTVPVIAGGEQASLYAQDVLTRIPGLDACLKGEAEVTVLEFIERLNDRRRWHEVDGLIWRNEFGIQHNRKRQMMPDLDVLPFPARDHLPAILAKGGETVISQSRGCWAKCTFCSIIEFFDHSTGAAWRGRSAQNVVAELKYLYETFGADRFWFVDDEFFGKSSDEARLRAEEVFRGIMEARLPIRFDFFCRAQDLKRYGPLGTFELAAQAGARRILCGIESGSAEALKLFNKGSNPQINRTAIATAEGCGIELLTEFILFNPWSTLDQIEECVSFLETVPRGTEGKMGKYDPINLSSGLYIHRETPLGRDFVANWGHLRKKETEEEKAKKKGDDVCIAYDFLYPRVQVLHDVAHATMQCFAPLEGVIEQLYRLVDRLWLPEWSEREDAAEVRAQYAHYLGQFDDLKSLRSDVALELFREALAFAKSYDLEETPEGIHAFRAAAVEIVQQQQVEAENTVLACYSLALALIQEVWEYASRKDLLGPRTDPPHCLVG